MDDDKVSIYPRNDILYASWINKYSKRFLKMLWNGEIF